LFEVFDKKGKTPKSVTNDTPSTSKHVIEENVESPAKKRKIIKEETEEAEQRQPIVADTFEQEARREVVASKGLGGGGPGEALDAESSGQVTLSLAVSHQVALPV